MEEEKSKTIPEFVIKEWMKKNQFEMGEFSLKVTGNIGIITDRAGITMQVKYDPGAKTVSEIKEQTIVKRQRSNTLESTHVEVTITDGSASAEVFYEIREALMKMRRLRKISYVVTEVGFEE